MYKLYLTVFYVQPIGRRALFSMLCCHALLSCIFYKIHTSKRDTKPKYVESKFRHNKVTNYFLGQIKNNPNYKDKPWLLKLCNRYETSFSTLQIIVHHCVLFAFFPFLPQSTLRDNKTCKINQSMLYKN